MTDTRAAPAEQTEADHDGLGEQTCFVVIGFGRKPDYATGRVLDLDLTYEKLIKPALDSVGVRAFRAVDVNVSGNIDVLTYRWLYQADLVIADLSTMDADVFYQLGVRYAQRPATTLVMAENGLFGKLPFDLSHTIIYGYEHLGDEIADDEVERFVPLLSMQLEKILAEPPVDSPVYTYLPGMRAPQWEDARPLVDALTARLDARREFQEAAATEGPIDLALVEQQSLGTLMEGARAARNLRDFSTARTLYRSAIDRYAAGTSDLGAPVPHFLWQRLALVTYKQVEHNDPTDAHANQKAIDTLHEAMEILRRECDAMVSTDPETLGLAGAINKRLYERTGDHKHFERSVGYYERGFYIAQDYYNGTNVSFMYTTEAARLAEEGDRFNAIVNYGHANIIRAKVAEICEAMIADASTFERRTDQEWLYLSLWEAYYGQGLMVQAERLEALIRRVAPEFAIDAWDMQRQRLNDALTTFNRLIEPDQAASPLPAVEQGAGVTLAELAARHAELQADVRELRRLIARGDSADAEPHEDTPAPSDVDGRSVPPVERRIDPASPVPAPFPAMGTTPSARHRIFISYSHADEAWRAQVKKFLRPVARLADVWDDGDIETGRNWHFDIQEAVRATKIAILLVTQDFFDSEYIRGEELKPFLAAAERRELDIWWIAVGYSTWKHSELKPLQCANDPESPLESMNKAEREKTLAGIADKLIEVASAWGVDLP